MTNIPILGQKKGYFISFEGIDGAGKGHQIDLLRQSLNKTGFEVTVYRSPGGTKVGEIIRDIVKDSNNTNLSQTAELLLMNASTAQLVHEQIIPALNRGEVVIADRFYHSTIVYQAFGRQIDNNIVKATIQYAVGDTVPDVTFMLDLPPDMAAKRTANRGTTDRFEEEESGFQARVRQGYDWLKSMEGPSKGKVVAIDASGTPEEVHNEIYRCVVARIGSMKEGSLIVDAGKKIII